MTVPTREASLAASPAPAICHSRRPMSIIDAVPTPEEIDRALGRLEMTARERNVAVGIASALPVSIDEIAKWAKAAESRGLLLVPITRGGQQVEAELK